MEYLIKSYYKNNKIKSKNLKFLYSYKNKVKNI